MENKTFSITYTGEGEIAGTIENVSEEIINDTDKLRELVKREINEKFPEAAPEELHYEKMNLEDAPPGFQAGVPLEIF
ncbi:MAG TPA: hypothetical protein VK892_00125 [Pyrinomonadaceae bacterium]|nr:hypothetical protein [Pyrinomonadaceae bacterium]